MGYTTEFKGKLTFAQPLTGPQLAHLNAMFSEDVRDHAEWQDHPFFTEGYYIQFELTTDFDGIEWDGSEKFYGAVECVNLITREMRKVMPEFCLEGELLAQGEEINDRWLLKMVDGVATKQKLVVPGKRIECPACGHVFIAEEQES